MEYEGELYAERLRRKAQAAQLSEGTAKWSTKIDSDARTKLRLAWLDAVQALQGHHRDFLAKQIEDRSLRSMATKLTPKDNYTSSYYCSDERLLSLIEAEHEALTVLAASLNDPWTAVPPEDDPQAPEPRGRVSFAGLRSGTGASFGDLPTVDPGAFLNDVNRIFEAHLVGLRLHHNSKFVPMQSHEMHDAVVEPTLFLLNGDARFKAAESAYQDALRELRNGDSGDAITDAGTALQETLKALGCNGKVLGDQLKLAKTMGLLRGGDAPLSDAIAGKWVVAQRNKGEAHTAEHGYTPSDAWMVVHVVGALIIRLSEAETTAD
ncbi:MULTISPECIES: hypothetical protein [unclassified Mycobacterium]|uniref:hypothetical protein n=1 Tax=unclassified Mycobacterium TaxID=2642494 RepID=UPI000748ABF0|nr:MULTISPECIES: hypothetical protein [unclassified Mycobacterium]KUH87094.1 hypothetical protein AU186_00095 [Mycobacterium sp. GA-1999]